MCKYYQTKEKGVDRKKVSKPKKIHAYIVWEDNDALTSSLSQEESEEANLCIMVVWVIIIKLSKFSVIKRQAWLLPIVAWLWGIAWWS